MKDLQIAQRMVKAAQRASSRGIYFNISFSKYKRLRNAKRCFYTGAVLDDIEGSPFKRTIDRLDCHKGYVDDNVVPCSYAFNQLKSFIEKKPMDEDVYLKGLIKMLKVKGKIK